MDRFVDQESDSKGGITLGEALIDMKNRSSFTVEDHDASQFMIMPEYIPVGDNVQDRADRARIIDRITRFSDLFAGKDDARELGIAAADLKDPRLVPLTTYHSFFDAVNELDEMAASQADEIEPDRADDKEELEEFRQFIKSKGKEVAEDLVFTVAQELSEKYPEIATRFTELVERYNEEDAASEQTDDARTHYALSSSIPWVNYFFAMRLNDHEGYESEVSKEREELTARLVREISPDLKQLGIDDNIQKYIHYSDE